MVGTRSGISTTTPSEKAKMKKKHVASKKPGAESNMHGVRVRGLNPSIRADGQAGGANAGLTVPPKNPSLSAARSAILKKAALSIADITGEPSSSSSSSEKGQDIADREEEVRSGESPIESPHKIVRGNPKAPNAPDVSSRDEISRPDDHEPTPEDVIGGMMGLNKDVTKDVPTSSQGQKRKGDQVQEAAEDILASLKKKTQRDDDVCLATLLSEKRKKMKFSEESSSVVPIPAQKKKREKMGMIKKRVKKPAQTPLSPVVEDQVIEEEDSVIPLGLGNKRSVGGQKLPKNIPAAPMDNVSFHKEDGVLKWRYVYHRAIFPEKELSTEALKIDAIMELLHDAEMLKTVTGIGAFYPALVKEFIVNLSSSFDSPEDPEFRKVFVRGHCF